MDEGTSGLAGVDLYWIPLGAGDHIVRVSGNLRGAQGHIRASAAYGPLSLRIRDHPPG